MQSLAWLLAALIQHHIRVSAAAFYGHNGSTVDTIVSGAEFGIEHVAPDDNAESICEIERLPSLFRHVLPPSDVIKLWKQHISDATPHTMLQSGNCARIVQDVADTFLAIQTKRSWRYAEVASKVHFNGTIKALASRIVEGIQEKTGQPAGTFTGMCSFACLSAVCSRTHQLVRQKHRLDDVCLLFSLGEFSFPSVLQEFTSGWSMMLYPGMMEKSTPERTSCGTSKRWCTTPQATLST